MQDYRLNATLQFEGEAMEPACAGALARRLRLDRSVLRFDGLKVVAPGNAAAGWRDTLRWEALFRVAPGMSN